MFYGGYIAGVFGGILESSARSPIQLISGLLDNATHVLGGDI